jgi:putative phosphotransacetylase
MEEAELKQLIRNVILESFAKRGQYYIPVAISARHVHLCQKDFEILFGKGASMTRYRDLSQPGQFASEQLVEVAGPKGSFKKVRVLGPARNDTQVEISISDSFTLGIKPLIRMSGNIAGSPGCTLVGPAGKVELAQGVIVAARHIHLSAEQTKVYGVKDGDVISLKAPPPREGLIGGIIVRSGKGHDLEVHLDTDEANGNGILCGTILEAVMGRGSGAGNGGSAASGSPAAIRNAGAVVESAVTASAVLDLVTERDVNIAHTKGEVLILCAAKGLISPAAADRAKEKGITIRRMA